MNKHFVGHDPQTGRSLILYSFSSVEKVPSVFEYEGSYCVAMLVWDAENATDKEIAHLSNKLILAGCAYVCCWGVDCERVHDLFDAECVERGFDASSDDTIMTTWHTDDTLDEFIHFSLLCTEPTQKYRNKCRSVLALVFGNTDNDNASKIERVFENPARFYEAYNR